MVTPVVDPVALTTDPVMTTILYVIEELGR
jgi:hypothetical protein